MLDNSDDNSNVGSMEEESLKRRQRLEELRNKRKNLEQNPFEKMIQDKVQLPKYKKRLFLPNLIGILIIFQFRPKFRSYNPTDENLKENSLPKATPENGNS